MSQKTAKLVVPMHWTCQLTLHDNEDDEQRFVIGPIHDICQRHKFLGLSQLACLKPILIIPDDELNEIDTNLSLKFLGNT